MLHRSDDLDRVFGALADPTRRALVERLARGPAPVKELARPLAMSLSAVLQHLAVLEDCGLVTSEKAGRVRTCRLVGDGLAPARGWLDTARTRWESRLDALGAVLDGPAPPPPPPDEERP